MLRLSADVGGTFTDLVLINDADGTMVNYKLSSAPGSGSAIVNGIHQICSEAGRSIEEIDLFLHSFTIATNAWLTRNGADVLLFVTDGYRDILEIADQRRPDLYNLATQKPAPILQRHQIECVGERMDAFGEVVEPLSPNELDRLVTLVAERNPQAVAVSLLFSHVNASHERQIGDAISRRFPDLPIYLSCDINPKIHEYQRANTTAAAAFVGPAVRQYTESLETQVGDAGMAADILYMRSDGGSSAPMDARDNPVKLLLSGPAGGVVAGIQVAQLLDIDNLVTFDMGGTSADFALIANRRSSVARERIVDGLPVRVPMLDIKAISAGGGSIARVDAGGALKVGPASAGSVPGPAAYGLGGTDATLTDALMVLGYMDAASFADDAITLDVTRAAAAIQAHVAMPLSLTVTDAALGMLSIANANMAGAIRVISVERGQDLRKFALLAFGGAGGLFAPFLLRELELNEVVIPPAPGVFAALGLQFADVKNDVQIAFASSLAALTEELITSALRQPAARLLDALAQNGFYGERLSIEVSADMRYIGQHHELNIALPTQSDANGALKADIRHLDERFSDAHELAYGYCDRSAAAEITGLRLEASGHLSKPQLAELPASVQTPVAGSVRPISLALGSEPVCANVYQRVDLRSGDRIDGPAIIEQADTTTLILDNQQATVSRHGFLRIREQAPDVDDNAMSE